MSADKDRKHGAAVVTVSDKGSAGEREDKSGRVVREMLESAGIEVTRAELIPDDLPALTGLLDELCGKGFNLIVTTGGTGLSPRDVTPEATLAVIDRQVPGMAEAMRAESLKVTPHAMISRAVCGLAGQTLIINLPGSPRGARECLEVVLPAVPHALEVASGSASECAT
ncbi:MAG: MogA/MoaB family molybdenum cofactor biosynthesis protein [Actinobacteria bacterium]|nr:MogA/MoaB family molybdenum cofactor biosynthesis protein [Actinomycetota bacterium]